MKRPAGSGSIEPLPNGKFRVRVRVAGQGRPTLGTYDTEAEASRMLTAHLRVAEESGEAASTSTYTIRTLGRQFLHARELADIRGIKIDRNRWAAHIDTAFFAAWPIKELTTRDVRKWRDELKAKFATKPAPGGKRVNTKRRLSRSARKNTINLLRVALDYAVEEDLIPSNPAHGVKLEKDLRTDVPWTYLEPHEQESIIRCDGIPLPERLIVQFAIGTGLRRGELWCLRRSDVHEKGARPFVYVRFGSPGKPPKNGKARRVPLTALALDAAHKWLALVGKYAARNPLGLMFPTRRGYCRHGRLFRAERRPEPTMRWTDMLRVAGIARRVRFHDLRHTCGSSLVAGWWGDPWPLVRVRDLLGHSSVTVTERYAHLALSTLEESAYATRMPGPTLAHD
jgi:integrase